MKRSPAVAGKFYPQDSISLKRAIESHVDSGCAKQSAIGIIAPHAGFMYSGDVAGSVYSQIKIPETVVLIGPNHTGKGNPVALMAQGTWSTPLGDVEIDAALATAILEQLPEARDDETAHREEHSLETQLPFLQYYNRNFKIVPLCLMRVSLEECERIAHALVRALKQEPREVLLVASSDMTHYETHERATEKDQHAIDCMLKLDARGLYETVRQEGITMCGVNPATVMLVAGKQLGATRARLTRYMTSGEVSGDMDYVVGYAGMIVQ